jgi:hypothetical protein
MKRFIIFIILLCVIGGCATWHPVNGRLGTENYVVEIPQGWMKYDSGATVMISRDGPYLQYVLLQERPLNQPFRHTRKRLTDDMLPHEMAQVIIDDLSSDRAVKNLMVIDNAPTVVDGYDAFRLIYSYQTAQGLSMKTAYYGFLHDHTYYSLRFTAPQRHYFEQDIQTFESILSNFRLVASR